MSCLIQVSISAFKISFNKNIDEQKNKPYLMKKNGRLYNKYIKITASSL